LTIKKRKCFNVCVSRVKFGQNFRSKKGQKLCVKIRNWSKLHNNNN